MNKVTYIEQGLPTSFTVNVEPPIRNVPPLKLMFLGRISPFKGLHILIAALDSFSDVDFELSIFGSADGTDYKSLLKEKKQTSTESMIRFLHVKFVL